MRRTTQVTCQPAAPAAPSGPPELGGSSVGRREFL